LSPSLLLCSAIKVTNNIAMSDANVLDVMGNLRLP
jgi:hypothetical protein